MNFRTEIITEFDAFLALRKDWDALCEKAGASAFVHSSWIISWQRAFGNVKSPLAFVVSYSGDRLVAGLALTIQPRPISNKLAKLKFKTLRFRSTDHAGFHEIVFDPDVPDVIPHLFDEVERQLSFNVFDLRPLRGGPGLDALCAAAKAKGYFVEKTQEFKNDCFVFDDGWDGYLEGRSRGLRKDMRKTLARAEEAGMVLDVAATNLPKDHAILDRILEVSALSWKSKSATDIHHAPEENRFFKDLLKEFSKTDQVALFCLQINGTDAATLVGLRSGDRAFGVLSDFNESMAQFGPGKLILALVGEYMAGQGVTRLECLRSTPLTQRFATEQQPLYRVFIAKKASLPSLLYTGIKVLSPIGKKARKSKQLRTKKRQAFKNEETN